MTAVLGTCHSIKWFATLPVVRKPVFHMSLYSLGPAQSPPRTLILLETTASLARGMLGRHSDHYVYFLKVKITMEIEPESSRQ